MSVKHTRRSIQGENI